MQLKTKGSERVVPLVGASLWAAQRALSASKASAFLFPRYCEGNSCKANSASAGLNKWLKQTVGEGYVIHSFRHSIRDRLREASCPIDMIDQLGGWARQSVGESYGEGFALSICHKQMSKILLA